MPFNSAPDFYERLNSLVLGSGTDLSKVNGFGFKFDLVATRHCIDTRDLSQAAAKYLLAQRVKGLSTDGYSHHSETPLNYGGQVIMSLSVVAFEAYCRLFQCKWFDVYGDIISDPLAERYHAQFSETPLDSDFFGRIKRSLDPRQGHHLLEKIEEFEAGKARNLYAIAVAFRNAFSHGRLGSLGGTAQVGECLREFVLEAIKQDCVLRCELIEAF